MAELGKGNQIQECSKQQGCLTTCNIREDDNGGAKRATGGHQQMLLMNKLGSDAGTMPEKRSKGQDKFDDKVSVRPDAGGRARSQR